MDKHLNYIFVQLYVKLKFTLLKLSLLGRKPFVNT